MVNATPAFRDVSLQSNGVLWFKRPKSSAEQSARPSGRSGHAARLENQVAHFLTSYLLSRRTLDGVWERAGL